MVANVKRVSSSDEMEKHLEIRRKVFMEEMHIPEKEERDRHDHSSKAYLAYDGHTAVGTGRVRETNKGLKIERIAVLSDYRGRGVGKALIEAIMKEIPREEVVFLQTPAETVPFFEKLGFKVRGEALWIADRIHHYMKFYPHLLQR